MAVDVEEALVELALAAAGVSAIAGTRVFPDRVPNRQQLPAVTFSRTSGSPIKKINGTSQVKRAMFRFEAYSGTSQKEARQLALALQGLHGTKTTQGDWWIQHILLVDGSESDDGIVPIFGDDLGAYRSAFEFDIGYNPAGI